MVKLNPRKPVHTDSKNLMGIAVYSGEYRERAMWCIFCFKKKKTDCEITLRVEVRILVVQSHHESDQDQIRRLMIQKRSPIRL